MCGNLFRRLPTSSITSMSSGVGPHAQWRRNESDRDRRERRQRSECRLRLRLVRELALLLTVVYLMSPMWSSAFLCLRCPCKIWSSVCPCWKLLWWRRPLSVLTKFRLESSLSELDRKVLGALAVFSGELSMKLAGLQELHLQLLADCQVGLRSELPSCVLNLSVCLKPSRIQ